MNTIPIVEVFETIQGEGPRLGKPSLFIRVGGCDLRCQFKGAACDTPYAVHTPQHLDKINPSLKYGYNKWHPYSVDQLTTAILDQKLRHLVWTGGHPLLYQPFILQVIKNLEASRYYFTHEFETQGTIIVDKSLAISNATSFNISVKLKSSNQEDGYDDKRISVKALCSFHYSNSVYKFVISDPINDIKEINQILNIRLLPVYVMPEGINREQVIANSAAVVKIAIDNNWLFTPREHINIWDIKKGV